MKIENWATQKKAWRKRILCVALASFSILLLSAQTAAPGYPLSRWLDAPKLHAATPREAGIDSAFLFHAVDSIITRAIEMRAFPGCQLLVARDGKVVIDSSFGYHDFSRRIPVENDHLYDLASLTKMTASTLALALLAERHEIDLDDRLSKFYKPFAGTDKARITFREVLAHRSGLPSGVPRPWLMTRDSLLIAIRDVPLRTKVYRYPTCRSCLCRK